MSDGKDTLYRESLNDVAGFSFDEPVVEVFKDMITRSVPGYSLILSLLGVISSRYAQDNTNCYDLGCSLGASTLAIRRHLSAKNCQIIGIDNSAPMIEQCKKNIALDDASTPVSIIHDDILQHPINNASISVLNFTLQFIPIEERMNLLTRIADATCDGGVLVLSEKIQLDSSTHDRDIIDLHHQFKRLNGYSALEIAQKRESLENILIPESIETHTQRLLACGFSDVLLCVQCFNFVSLLAIK
ncbi:MAG: carboxy-S-adenosyl-L-methionine synthase CmoA [Pseudomonadota bacterium]